MLQKLFCSISLFFSLSTPLLSDALPPSPPQSIYDIVAETILGVKVPLSGYRGRVLLIVNIATSGPLVDQLTELESLYGSMSEEGLSILGFPSNDFVSGKPATQEEIVSVCFETYKLSFPIFKLTHLQGSFKDPVYQFLTSSRTNPIYGGDVSWNFVKFLLDREGKIIGRFASNVAPKDPKIKEAIQKALGSKA
jgi:glutathione peroxidase